MAALLVALSVMSVMMSVAMPVWKQAAQREKEDELIFRGQQYTRAIGLFQRKNGPGTLPPSLDVLLAQRFLRRKYKDPISNDDFQPLFAGQVVQGGQPAAGGTSSLASATTSTPSTGGRGGGPPANSSPLGAASGGVMGVVSKSKGASIRLYNGRGHYNEWAFIFTAPTQTPGTPAAGAAPGVGRQGGRGVSGAGVSTPGVGGVR